jgi:hypothetical protein
MAKLFMMRIASYLSIIQTFILIQCTLTVMGSWYVG